MDVPKLYALFKEHGILETINIINVDDIDDHVIRLIIRIIAFNIEQLEIEMAEQLKNYK